jgi:hypothetical protein
MGSSVPIVSAIQMASAIRNRWGIGALEPGRARGSLRAEQPGGRDERARARRQQFCQTPERPHCDAEIFKQAQSPEQVRAPSHFNRRSIGQSLLRNSRTCPSARGEKQRGKEIGDQKNNRKLCRDGKRKGIQKSCPDVPARGRCAAQSGSSPGGRTVGPAVAWDLFAGEPFLY